jgi:hypothetical protein
MINVRSYNHLLLASIHFELAGDGQLQGPDHVLHGQANEGIFLVEAAHGGAAIPNILPRSENN